MYTFADLVTAVTFAFDPFDNAGAFTLVLNSPVGAVVDFGEVSR